jgi:hypothetical protein
MPRDLPTAVLLLMLFCPAAVLAQEGAAINGPPVAFPQVTAVPIPLESTSGRFSSLNPPRQTACANRRVTGRVVSIRLIQVKQFDCLGNDASLPLENVLMNVQLGNPADTGQMVVGRLVIIEGSIKIAQEPHGNYLVFFLIAEKARPVAGEPSAAPASASTSYMMCQAPELDALASQLGRELCVQSTIMANLNAAGPALQTAARALVQDSPKDAASSDSIICRQDRERSDAHLAAMACARESYWDWWSLKQRGGQNFTKPAPP